MPNAGPGGCQDGLSNCRYQADPASVPAPPTAAVAATAAEVTSSDDAFPDDPFLDDAVLMAS